MKAEPVPSSAPRPSLAVTAALVLLGSVLVFLRPINHDVAWYLSGAQHLLNGGKLYVDIVDVNPPLIFLLNVPPALVAHWTGGSDIALFRVYALLLIAGSLVLCALVEARFLRGESFAVLLPVLAYVFLFPIEEQFGQREHLMWVFVTPYLLMAVARAQSPDRRLNVPLAILVGLCAGLGLALKPYYLALWLSVELYLAIRRRRLAVWLRAESLVILGVFALYALYVLLETPEYLKTIVPLAQQVYGAFDAAPAYLLTHPALPIWLLGVGLWLLVRRPSAGQDFSRVFLIASTVLLAAAWIQRKGWDYHYYGATAASCVLIALLGADLVREPRLRQGALLTAGVTLVVSASFHAARQVAFPAQAEQLRERLRPEFENRNFAALASSLYPAFPLANYLHAQWSLRFNHLWPLPGFYRTDSPAGRVAGYHRPEQMSAAEKYVFDAVIADLEAHPPGLMLVDASANKAGFGGVRFDYLEYFSQDEGFRSFLSGYEQCGSFGVYQAYRPKAAAPDHRR